ncbi:MAG: protein kinase [Planctomycetota bacterium]
MSEPSQQLPTELIADLERLRQRSLAEVRREVQRLAAEDPARRGALTSWLESVVADGAAGAAIAPPDHVGQYRILGLLGEGGMGAVYLAEQTVPVHRRVALKLVKPGMDSAAILRRFEIERQSLALMQHEGIATIHDCGTSERGQPFFVMELVEGSPLTEFCDREKLPIERRLLLMQDVCAAVTHAHQKGVVHRDLKPGNVLVANRDGKPAVKVIDFGLAKVLDAGDAARGPETVVGSVLGTPEYMAPEQARANGGDVDTQGGRPSLGVMLYRNCWSVCCRWVSAHRARDRPDLLRRLAEVEPVRPSSRLTASGVGAKAAAARRTSTSALFRLLKTDLDWIVLKALAKERERRYQSAADLAEDLRRFLEHKPVSAGPPGIGYRLRPAIRRHRIGLTVALALAATAATGALFWTAEHTRSAVLFDENLELRAGRRFRDAILWEWLDASVGGRTTRHEGRDRTLRELADVEALAPRFELAARYRELLVAEAAGRAPASAPGAGATAFSRFAAARAFAKQRRFDDAMPLLRTLIADEHFGPSALMYEAVLLTTQGQKQFDLAVQRLQQAAGVAPGHPVLLCNLAGFYFRMEPRQLTARIVGGQLRDLAARLDTAMGEFPERGELQLARAWVALTLGGPRTADTVRPLLERAVELMPDHPEALGNLGQAYLDTARETPAERDDEVEQWLTKARAAFERSLALAADQPIQHFNLAVALLALREKDLAAKHAQTALETGDPGLKEQARSLLQQVK